MHNIVETEMTCHHVNEINNICLFNKRTNYRPVLSVHSINDLIKIHILILHHRTDVNLEVCVCFCFWFDPVRNTNTEFNSVGSQLLFNCAIHSRGPIKALDMSENHLIVDRKRFSLYNPQTQPNKRRMTEIQPDSKKKRKSLNSAQNWTQNLPVYEGSTALQKTTPQHFLLYLLFQIQSFPSLMMNILFSTGPK